MDTSRRRNIWFLSSESFFFCHGSREEVQHTCTQANYGCRANSSCYSSTISGWLEERCADGGLSRMQIRRTSSQVGKRIAADANCSWQPGGLTPPTKTLCLVPPRNMPVIEMEIQEGVLKGEEMSHLTSSQSLCSCRRYNCPFLCVLADNHSWHTFAMPFATERLGNVQPGDAYLKH